MKSRPIVFQLTVMVLLLGLVIGVTRSFAQTVEPPGVSAPPAQTELSTWVQIQEFLGNLGSLKYPLLAVSVVTVALVIYLLIVMWPSQVAPRRLRRNLEETLTAGRLDEARRDCEAQNSPLARVALAGIEYMRSSGVPDAMLVKEAMESEGTRQAERIQGQIQYLQDVVAVAPMLGLLGTVFGMVGAFRGVAEELASAKPVMLAAGVSQALHTTAFGLVVGIFAMICYAIFRQQASRLISHLELTSAEVRVMLMKITLTGAVPEEFLGVS